MRKGYIICALLLIVGMLGCDDTKDSDADAGTDAGAATDTGGTDTNPIGSTDTGQPLPSDTGNAECFHTEACSAIPYERQTCQFPLTPVLDGDTSDSVWANANWETVTSTMGLAPADSDADASFEFACVADANNIYIAFRVHDDTIVSGENEECDIWMDDSLEFYIDGCYGRESFYDGDDAQISLGAENIGVTDQSQIVWNGGCGNTGTPIPGPETGSQAVAVATADGWAGEIAIPMNPTAGWALEPADGQIIGFNMHYNDDDDQGDRDAKLIWGLTDRETDGSWDSTGQFDSLQFCQVGSVPTDTPTDMGTDTDTTMPDGGDVDGGTSTDTAQATDTATADVGMDAGDDAGADGGK